MDERTLGEKIADAVAKFGGSWKFILTFTTVLIAWIVINTVAFFKFDPFPFILLNLLLSFVAAFQAPFIMMSQNRAEKKQDEAYRKLFDETKELVQNGIDIENNIVEMVRIDHEDEVKYRIELHGLTRLIKELIELDREDEKEYRDQLQKLAEHIKEMVEIDHSDEVQYKKEINSLTKEMSELKQMVKQLISEDESI